MKKAWAAVAVALAIGSFVLVGCTKGESNTNVAPSRAKNVTAEQAKTGSAPAKAATVKLSDQELKNYVEQVPQDQWKNLDPDVASQVEAYAKQHPEVKYQAPGAGGQ